MISTAANDGMGSLRSGATCRFRVWAPNAALVQVKGDFNGWTLESLQPEGNGNWSGVWSDATASPRGALPGDMYKYVITNKGGPWNDNSQPWERTDARALQVQGSSGWCAGYIGEAFPATRPYFKTPAFDDFLIYQLHVGSYSGRNDGMPVFSFTGTFVQLKAKLGYIRGLGFNAIQLLPVNSAFCDLHGAGMLYGAADLYASENLYASAPKLAVVELIDLIDAAHGVGLAVILDLVYNHASTSDNRYWRYDGNCNGDNGIAGGIYFNHGHHTPWGEGFAVWQQEIKDFLLDNARMYLRDYKVDGLRFDAVQAIPPDGVEYVVQNLRHEFPDKYLIAEYNPNDGGTSVMGPLDPWGTLGFCAIWNMDSPWDTFKLLSGDDVVNRLLARIGSFSDPNPWHQVNYLAGSHDQIYAGNSGVYMTQRFGGRYNGYARAKARLAWALTATLAGTPMMFMGTEGHQDQAWDPWVGDWDRRLDWSQMGDWVGAPMQQMVRDVNGLRWAHPALRGSAGVVLHKDYQSCVVAFTRFNLEGDLLLVVVNAGDGQWGAGNYGVNMGGEDGWWKELFNSQAPGYGGVGTVGNYGFNIPVNNGMLWINLSSWSVVVFAKQ